MADRFEELRRAAEQGTLSSSDLQQADSVVENPVQEDEQEVPASASEKELKKAKTLNIILLLMVFILIGLFAFLFFTDRLILGVANPFAKDAVIEEDQEEDTELGQDDDTELTEDDEVVTQKEYVDSVMGVKFTYPNDWVLLSDQKGNNSLLVRVGEKEINPNFVFEYHLPSASGPAVCIYPDTTNADDIFESIIFDDFTTIKAGELRRSFVEESSTYKVCKKGASDTFYTNWLKAGYVTYHVNMDEGNSADMLKILDGILLSLEYTGDME